MYAQLVRERIACEPRTELDRVAADELIPALREETGFAGALNLVDRQGGTGMMIVFWKTGEQAQRPLGHYGATLLAAFSHLEAISTGDGGPISVWEVSLRV